MSTTDNNEITGTTKEKKKAVNVLDLKYVKAYINTLFKERDTKIAAIQTKLTSIDGDIAGLEDEIPSISSIYPVGSIYMSVNNTNPAILFGGTWEEWGVGKTIVGVDGNDSDFSVSEKTGGEKVHTLTISEMPLHDHKECIDSDYAYDPVETATGSTTKTFEKRDFTTSYKIPLRTSKEGGDQAHNNLQPYITCYMWKRTA